MPRQARLDAPGRLHHVMIRGIVERGQSMNLGIFLQLRFPSPNLTSLPGIYSPHRIGDS
jgi:hypothetical protein